MTTLTQSTISYPSSPISPEVKSPEIEPPLQSTVLTREQDAAWLQSFGIEIDDATLDTFQALIDADTPDLRVDDSNYQAAVDARDHFFDAVGLPYDSAEDNARVKLQDRRSTLSPLHTVVGTLRVLANNGLDAAKIMNKHPAAVGYAPESVQEKVDNFKSLGLDYVTIMNKFPAAVSYAPESVQEKVDNFKSLGLDYATIMNKHPAAVGYAPESVQEKVDNFKSLGLDYVTIMNKFPAAVSYAPESVQEKVDNFKSLGLDYATIMNKHPAAVGYAPESVQEKVDNFKSLGLDYATIMNKFPAAVSLAPESVQEKVDNFKSLGLDYATIMNKFPVAVGYAQKKVTNCARLLRKAGRWEDVRSQWNAGKKLDWLTLPTESIIIALGTSTPAELTERLENADRVKEYVKPVAPSRRERLANVHSRIGSLDIAKQNPENREFANRLGAAALLGLLRQAEAKEKQ